MREMCTRHVCCWAGSNLSASEKGGEMRPTGEERGTAKQEVEKTSRWEKAEAVARKR